MLAVRTLRSEEPDLLAIAEVERIAFGRFPPPPAPPLPVPLPTDESRSRNADSPPLSPPLFALRGAEAGSAGPGVDFAEDGSEKETWEAERFAVVVAPELWERCRMVSSDGLRRRSWDLTERCPGVWLRGMGVARS